MSQVLSEILDTNNGRPLRTVTFPFKYVVFVEILPSVNSSWPQRLVSMEKLDDPNIFPIHSQIASPLQRQKWKEGDEININWPADSEGKRKKGLIKITPVKVHGVYVDKISAENARKALEDHYKELSDQRENANTEVGNENNELFNDDNEYEGSLARLDSPVHKRQRNTRQKYATESFTGANAALIAVAIQMVQQCVDAISERLDLFGEKLDQLQTRATSIEKEVKIIAKKLDCNVRKTSEISRQVGGKAVAATRETVDFSADFITDPIVYMGVDRTAEINKIFEDYGSNDKKFVKRLAEHFYGDDLYFWMIKPDVVVGGKESDRKSLQQKDPEGVAIIFRIFQSYWTLAIWPHNLDNIKKTSELSAADVSPETSRKIRSELKVLRRLDYEKWRLTAVEWFNGWGSDCRTRKTSFPWTKSLYGRTITDPCCVKPDGYNPVDDEKWRQKLLSLKSRPRRQQFDLPIAISQATSDDDQ